MLKYFISYVSQRLGSNVKPRRQMKRGSRRELEDFCERALPFGAGWIILGNPKPAPLLGQYSEALSKRARACSNGYFHTDLPTRNFL